MTIGWGSLLKPRDARGRESRTLAFVGISWIAVTAKFALDSFGPAFGLAVSPALITATEYGAVTSLLVGVWVGREWVDIKRGDSHAH
jgi:hypothetical protein